jgi:PAS domain S-box-containing protein
MVSALPIFMIGVLVFIFNYSNTQESIETHNQHLNRIVKNELELFLHKPYSIIEQLRVFISEPHSEQTLHTHLDNLARHNQFFESILILNSNGVVTSIGSTLEYPNHLEHSMIGVNFLQHPSFTQAQQRNTPWWSEAYLSLVSGQLSMTISYAHPDGRVIVGNFTVEQLDSLAKKIPHNDLTIAILDQKGMLLFHTDPKVSEHHPNISNIPPIKAALKGESGTYNYRHNGISYLGSIDHLENSGMIVLVSLPQEQALAPLTALTWFFIFALITVALMSLLFAKFMAQRIIKPLNHFTEATQRISKGQYDIPIPSLLSDEFSGVAGSMQAMARAVQQREANLNHLIGSTRSIPWRLNIETQKYDYIGPQLKNILGYYPEDWKSFAQRDVLLHPQDRSSVQNYSAESTQRGEEHQLEYRIRHASGEMIWIHDVISVEMVAGNPKYLVGFMIDITDRKQLERDLIQTLGTLDHKVNERTTELHDRMKELEITRSELIKSEKMASLGRMVAGFSHEINTPIGIAVSGSSGAIDATNNVFNLIQKEEVDEDELKGYLNSIKEMNQLALSNLKRAATLISSFKRTTIDQSSDEARCFNLSDSLNDVIASLRSTAFKNKQVKIYLDIPSDLTIDGYPGVIDQLFNNLMINSLRYGFKQGTRPGSIHIQSIISNGLMTLTYQDDGSGMERETIEHAFEPFYTTGRSIGGSGLGLYICYNLVVNRLEGSIDLESSLGQGVKFTIQFPVTVIE